MHHGERGEKTQRKFPCVYIVLLWGWGGGKKKKRDEAQQVAAAGCGGQEVNSAQYEVACDSCYFHVEMTERR